MIGSHFFPVYAHKYIHQWDKQTPFFKHEQTSYLVYNICPNWKKGQLNNLSCFIFLFKQQQLSRLCFSVAQDTFRLLKECGHMWSDLKFVPMHVLTTYFTSVHLCSDQDVVRSLALFQFPLLFCPAAFFSSLSLYCLIFTPAVFFSFNPTIFETPVGVWHPFFILYVPCESFLKRRP